MGRESYQPSSVPRKPRQRWGMLLAMLLGIGGVWLVALPRLARHPVIQKRQTTFDALGIDPAAMFYTELELLDSPHNRLQQWQREHPKALW